MPLSRQQKESLASGYGEGLTASPHVFLLDYKGITVTEVTELRAKIREAGGSYEVVKNRVALRALAGTALDDLKDQFQGPTAAAYGGEDPVVLAKILTEFAKDVPCMEFKDGLVEGQRVSADEVKQIADLPSREQLITKLVFLLQSPITGFVRVLAALPRNLVVSLDQIRQQKES